MQNSSSINNTISIGINDRKKARTVKKMLLIIFSLCEFV